MCLEIYELYPPHFLTAPGLAWQTTLKKTKVKLDPCYVIKVSEKEYVTLFINMQKLITNT